MSSSNATSTTVDVRQLKEDLSKCPPGDVERLTDILQRLDEADVTLTVLTETLVGAAVSKLKCNPDRVVSERAKGLIKKWKAVAKSGGGGGGGGGNKKPAAVKQGSSSGGAGKKPAPKTSAAASSASSTAGDDGGGGGDAEEWAHLPPLRRNICSKFLSILRMSHSELTAGDGGLDPAALSHLCTSRAAEMEAAVQSRSRGDSDSYKEKARSLVFNLKKNGPLREQILLGVVSGDRLCSMKPDELLSADKARARAKMVGDLQDSRRLDWEQANEARINEQCGIKGDLLKASLFTCGRCKSIKTTSTQKQTRSADEPMTVFVLCLNCGNRWKC